jgi:DNA-binding NarL/FixJ family response regulator
MNISEGTASTYRTLLMEKLGLSTTAELIRFALENGIIG